jgi:hypothetical protein
LADTDTWRHHCERRAAQGCLENRAGVIDGDLPQVRSLRVPCRPGKFSSFSHFSGATVGRRNREMGTCARRRSSTCQTR